MASPTLASFSIPRLESQILGLGGTCLTLTGLPIQAGAPHRGGGSTLSFHLHVQHRLPVTLYPASPRIHSFPVSVIPPQPEIPGCLTPHRCSWPLISFPLLITTWLPLVQGTDLPGNPGSPSRCYASSSLLAQPPALPWPVSSSKDGTVTRLRTPLPPLLTQHLHLGHRLPSEHGLVHDAAAPQQQHVAWHQVLLWGAACRAGAGGLDRA